MAYSDIAARVVALWNARYSDERPFRRAFEEWFGIDYPLQAGHPRARAQNQGVIQPDTDFVECLANARSYAPPHLLQLAEALDHDRAAHLRDRLTETHEVLVVDIGCAAGILSLFVDRAGFSHYVGIDTNRWMRVLSRAAFGTVMDELTGWEYDPALPHQHLDGFGGWIGRHQYSVINEPDDGTTVRVVRSTQPSFGILEDIDSHDGWMNFVRRVSGHIDLLAAGARRITVLLVMNHLMFQLHDVPRTVTSAIDRCRELAVLPGVHPFLLSIEPGTLYKPGRLGTQGLDRVLLERQLQVERFSVTGLSTFLTGTSKGNAAVRLVRFGA